MSVKMTALTSGQSSPASVATGTGFYRWRGHADWTPNDPRFREETSGAPAVCKAEKAVRLKEFAGYLEQGLTAQQAGRLIGIAAKTARTYERELQEQQRGDGRDA
jgi:hypothetical protein